MKRKKGKGAGREESLSVPDTEAFTVSDHASARANLIQEWRSTPTVLL